MASVFRWGCSPAPGVIRFAATPRGRFAAFRVGSVFSSEAVVRETGGRPVGAQSRSTLDSEVGVDKLASRLASQFDLMQSPQIGRVIVWLFQLDELEWQSIEIWILKESVGVRDILGQACPVCCEQPQGDEFPIFL